MQKSEISPHDRFFSKDIDCDIRDKYELCGKSDDDEYNGIHNNDYGDGDGDDEYDDAMITAQVTSIDRH